MTLKNGAEFELQDAVDWDIYSDGAIVDVEISDAGTPNLITDDFIENIKSKHL